VCRLQLVEPCCLLERERDGEDLPVIVCHCCTYTGYKKTSARACDDVRDWAFPSTLDG
jgi:hypothetical protein